MTKTTRFHRHQIILVFFFVEIFNATHVFVIYDVYYLATGSSTWAEKK